MCEHSGTKQRGCICTFNMLMCAVVIGLAGTLGAGTVTRVTLQGEIDAAAARGGEISDIVMDNCRVKATTDALVAIDTDVLYQFRNLPTYDERLTDIHDIAIRNVTCERTPHLVRLAGSATYAAAERAAREHPELVGRLIRAQGEKTVASL